VTTALFSLLHLLGLLAALHAILKSSTPQGAVGWSIALVAFPAVVLPLYLVFGSTHFGGYVEVLRTGTLAEHSDKIAEILEQVVEYQHQANPAQCASVNVLQKLARMPFLDSCRAELLIDGQATYRRMHEELAKAREYILVLYYKVLDDESGRAFRDHLMERSRQGIRVYFVFDELGSAGIRGSFLRRLRAAGVKAFPFRTARGFRHSLQLNFRNHRKILVVDGKVALVGGLNIGDRYLGRSRHFGPWRDTHVVLEGPAVMGVQLVFAEDYYWATGGTLPEVSWRPQIPEPGTLACTYLSSGPADRLKVGLLFFLECIGAARTRLWLATPYFIPDSSILNALRMADLRGVEVRILIPPGRYEPGMRLAALSFLAELRDTGIKLYEYPGYNHSKVMLVDDWLSWVGSSNLDSRSLRLNFEGNFVALGADFGGQVKRMLEEDFAHSTPLNLGDLNKIGLLTRLGSRLLRLLAPVL